MPMAGHPQSSCSASTLQFHTQRFLPSQTPQRCRFQFLENLYVDNRTNDGTGPGLLHGPLDRIARTRRCLDAKSLNSAATKNGVSATWNLETGLSIPGVETPSNATGQDPLAVLRSLASLGERISDELAGAGQLPSVPAIHRNRPSPDPADPTRQTASDVRRDLGSRGQHPRRTRKAVHRDRTRPTKPRAVGRDRAADRDRAK